MQANNPSERCRPSEVPERRPDHPVTRHEGRKTEILPLVDRESPSRLNYALNSEQLENSCLMKTSGLVTALQLQPVIPGPIALAARYLRA